MPDLEKIKSSLEAKLKELEARQRVSIAYQSNFDLCDQVVYLTRSVDDDSL